MKKPFVTIVSMFEKINQIKIFDGPPSVLDLGESYRQTLLVAGLLKSGALVGMISKDLAVWCLFSLALIPALFAAPMVATIDASLMVPGIVVVLFVC